MTRRAPDDRDIQSFAPRVTIALVAGFLLFVLIAFVYALPDCLGERPAGAIADYCSERMRARLDGKVLWMLLASYAIVAGLAIRGILPGTGRRT